MRKSVIICLLTGMMIVTGYIDTSLPVEASSSYAIECQSRGAVNNQPVLRAIKIEMKYRSYHGKLQYRRWNRTEKVWVDPDWIDVP